MLAHLKAKHNGIYGRHETLLTVPLRAAIIALEYLPQSWDVLMNNHAMSIDVLEKITIFQGYFRVHACRLRHSLFGSGWSGEMRREVFERGHAAAVLLYDPDAWPNAGAFVMREQFRVGAYAGGMEPWMVEIVANIIEDGELPEDVCRREAVAESGRTITDTWPIQRYLASPGGTSETIYLFISAEFQLRTQAGFLVCPASTKTFA
jgi:nudix-type nucleoside diphosphatase (YffH/AdpP family)